MQIARVYQDTRERVCALMTRPDDAAWAAELAACPGWSVRDVLAHMTAVAEDWEAGRLTGPPTDAETAAQIARFLEHDVASVLTAWSEAAARLERMAETGGAPPLGDVVVHEHDVRAAMGRPGARESEAVWLSSDQLLNNLRTPVALRVQVEDGEYRCGPDGGHELRLRTGRFEALRWRTGRRSRAQLAAMDWSDDPAPVLDHLYLFGPAVADVVEDVEPVTTERSTP
jgi:uncharacterized protein (TIGR03083 family)